MKTFVKILSMFVMVVMLVSVGTIGMTAYAEPSDYFGEYDFTVVDNPYEKIEWDNGTLHAFKSSTHAHTVRSDADIELNDTIWEHYNKGYEVLSLTDHGTVNGVDIEHDGKLTGATDANAQSCGWTEDQDRCTLYAYQSFVHGNIDEITKSDYLKIINGEQTGSRSAVLVDQKRGMFNLPLGNECNEASSNKCHVNTYHISWGHGENRNVSWPESTVAGNYNDGGFSRINHVGEWTEGNDDPGVYTESWVDDFVKIFTTYCPNRKQLSSETALEFTQKWYNNDMVTGEPVKKGVIGIELVNTSDSRTKNDRKYVYDAMLQKLAPQGINVYGFCEDDSHEESDVDRNAQYFLVNDGTAYSDYDYEHYSDHYGADGVLGYTGDIRNSMMNGEFYACSKNSKNSYELGDGFSASGDYPSINNFEIDEQTDKVIIGVNNASKVRLVADGVIVATKNIAESSSYEEISFDLNQYEDLVNSYIRVYLTGKGGICYLQPVLLTKTSNKTSHVQFNLPSSDTEFQVFDSTGAVIETQYNDNIYVLPAGTYSYIANRAGYEEKNDTFTVTQAQIDAGEKQVIDVVLDQRADVSFAYFYAPETIYVNPNDGKTFQYYVDRENPTDLEHCDVSALNSISNKTTGNLFFYRKGATNITITASFYEGDSQLQDITYGIRSTTTQSVISTEITGGTLETGLANGQYVLILWDAKYSYGGTTCHSYTYSYVYKTLSGGDSVAAAAAYARTNNGGGWLHSDTAVTATVWLAGTHSVGGGSTGYKYAPYGGTEMGEAEGIGAISATGSGMCTASDESSGGSRDMTASGAYGVITVDKSRTKNLNQVPYLKYGLDINKIRKGNDTINDSSNPPIYVKFAGAYKFSLNNVNPANYSAQRVYESTSDTISYSLEYTSVNTIPIVGHVYTSYEGRHDSMTGNIELRINYVDKTNLRVKLNDSIKFSNQQDWFENGTEYENYRKTLVHAAKVLGNPAATTEEIESSISNIDQVEKNLKLKTGKATVKHYWSYNNKTGLIKSEDSYSFTFNNTIVASAVDIDGYVFNNQYDCFVNGEKDDSLCGTASYSSLTGANDEYEWHFYYSPNIYVVKYVAGSKAGSYQPANDGGNVYTASYGQEYTIATNTPSRVGYTFEGWYLDLDTSEKAYQPGEVIQYNYLESGTLSAKWVPNTYLVSYDLNNGAFKTGEEPKDEELTIHYDEVLKLPTGVPERTGYNFKGWKLNGDKVYSAGSQITWDFTSNGNLVAQWQAADYKVTYDKNADDAKISDLEKEVTYDSAYGTLATIERTGYTYEWYSNPSFPNNALVTNETIVKIAGDHTLTAKWTPISYKITYSLVGGVEGTNPTTYTIEDDAITLAQPTRTGYEFIGWSGTDLDNTVYHMDVTIPAASYGNRVYTAHWKAIDYKINYVLGADDAVNDPNNPTGYTVADEIIINPATRTGYTFIGWTGEDYSKAQTIMISAGKFHKDLTFTADWKITTYTIDYKLNNGVLEGANPTQYDIETDSFTLINPTRDGYDFEGWRSDYYTGVKNEVVIEKGSTGNKTFTAVWRSGDNLVTYELNHGSVDGTNPENFESGESYTLISPVRQGYTFKYWIKQKLVDGALVEETMVQGVITPEDIVDLTFIAVWEPIVYSLSYEISGGRFETYAENPNPETYTPDSDTFTLVNPIRAGYKFGGWSGSEIVGKSKAVTINSGSIGDRNYTANWDVVTYNISYDLSGGSTSTVYTYNITTTANIPAATRLGYTFAGYEQTYHTFTWKSGYFDENGLLLTGGDYVDSVISSPFRVNSGYTYSISSSIGVEHLEIHMFDVYGNYQANMTLTDSEFTPKLPGYAYIVAKEGYTTPAMQDSIEIAVKNQDGTLQNNIAINPGCTGNFKVVAKWNVVDYNITYNLDGGSFVYEDEDGEDVYETVSRVNPLVYNTETETFILENPVKLGYTFTGWADEKSTSTRMVVRKGSTGDLTFSAKWNLTTFTISYKLNNGINGENNPSSYTYETETFSISVPSRTGYTFDGWTGTGLTAATTSITIEKGSTGNREYTANWSPIRYTITYNLNGGTNSSDNPVTYTVEDTFTLKNPTKLGATFSGWSGPSLSGTVTNVTILAGSSTGNLNYTANWDMSTFDITYSLDGGLYYDAAGDIINNPNPTTYSVNDTFTLVNPQKKGYKFLGWSGTGLSGISEYVTVPLNSTNNRNYVANWQVIDYTIIYNLDGGKVGIANPTSYNVETATFTLNNPVKAGYTFLGWTGTNLAEPVTTVTVTRGSVDSRTYTANWSLDEYTITYNYNNATEITPNPEKYSYVSNQIKLNNPERTGYEFTGWSGTGITGTGLSLDVVIPTGSTGNRIYTANWQIIEYNISYDFAEGKETVKNPRTYNVLSAPITLYQPQRDGYNFIGWTTGDEDEAIKPTVTIPTGSSGDKHFIANWEEAEYTITYDLAGGSLADNETNPKVYKYNTETFTLYNPTKQGYKFVGWSGTGISGTLEVVSVETGSTGNRNYVAVWAEEEAIVITYDLQGGEILEDTNPTSYIMNSGTFSLVNPSRTGYTFKGWSGTVITEGEYELDVEFDTSYGKPVTFIANWNINNYRITYTLGGGSYKTGETNPSTYTVEDQVELNNPEREGYNFKGWTGSNGTEANPLVTIVKGSIGNKRYTAVWEEVVYKISYDLGDGSVDGNPQTYTFSTETFTLNNPTCTGYTFIGWTGSNGTTPQTSVQIVKGSTGDKSYKANYELNYYTIRYLQLEGSKYDGDLVETYCVTDTFTLPTPSKLGYAFSGWSGTGIIGLAPTVTIANQTGNRIYTANWSPINYTIAYDYNGGRVSGTNPTSYSINSANISVLNPGRAGYKFNGWEMSYVDFNWTQGTLADVTGSYSSPVTLKAGTTYVVSGAQIAVYNENDVFIELVDGNEYTPESNCIARLVTSDSTDSVTLKVKGTIDSVAIEQGSMGNISLKAIWGYLTYNITYNYNGGALASGVENPDTYTPEDTFVLNNPTKTGYTFAGWTGTGLSSASTAVLISLGSSGNRVYTANWTVESYNLVISLDGGSFPEGSDVPDKFNINTPTFTLPIPRKTGYTFNGWVDENNTPVTGEIKQGTVGDVTLTATWTKNDDASGTHRIYFYGFKGEELGYVTAGVGITFTAPDPTVVVGYQFNGWVDANGNSINLNSSAIVDSTEDIYVYSNYTTGIDTYDITINGVTATYTQYSTVKATADSTSDGKQFSYWTDENGKIVSYYRSFSFRAHADTTLTAVYGAQTSDDAVMASIRITKAEWNSQYKWITFYAERSIYSSYTVIQHGIMFTDNIEVAGDADKFVLSGEDVYVGTAEGKTRSGVYTLSVGGLSDENQWFDNGNSLYARGYIIVADANGNSTTVYSDVPDEYTYGLNMQDKLTR